MGRQPLPAVRDLTRDGRWSTYDVSVRKKMGGGDMRRDRLLSTATISNKSRPAGSFSSSLPGGAPCRPGVLCICLFSGENCVSLKISRCFFFNDKQQFKMFSTGSAWTSPGAATTCASARQATAARDASISPALGNSSYTLISTLKMFRCGIYGLNYVDK
jgi:hypothetical protein